MWMSKSKSLSLSMPSHLLFLCSSVFECQSPGQRPPGSTKLESSWIQDLDVLTTSLGGNHYPNHQHQTHHYNQCIGILTIHLPFQTNFSSPPSLHTYIHLISFSKNLAMPNSPFNWTLYRWTVSYQSHSTFQSSMFEQPLDNCSWAPVMRITTK